MSDTIKALTERVRGRVITASDPAYDDARSVDNTKHDRRPLAIVQCTDSAEGDGRDRRRPRPRASTWPSGAAATKFPASARWTTG